LISKPWHLANSSETYNQILPRIYPELYHFAGDIIRKAVSGPLCHYLGFWLWRSVAASKEVNAISLASLLVTMSYGELFHGRLRAWERTPCRGSKPACPLSTSIFV